MSGFGKSSLVSVDSSPEGDGVPLDLKKREDLDAVIILGPTGSGKTGVSIKLAKALDGEIISADSRAIYKGMDIGTAKPTVDEMEGVPHYGIDLVWPDERFTVADWKEYAERKMKEIKARGHLPIIVGGTGLYIDALIYDYKFRKAAENASRVIAISECTRNDIVEMYGIDPKKIDVVYQGCDPLFQAPVTLEARQRVKEKYNLPERFIVAVGTVESRKNQLLAVKALRGLPDDVKLVIVGRRTAYATEIDNYIASQRGLASRVMFLEGVPFIDLPVIYALAVKFPNWKIVVFYNAVVLLVFCTDLTKTTSRQLIVIIQYWQRCGATNYQLIHLQTPR